MLRISTTVTCCLLFLSITAGPVSAQICFLTNAFQVRGVLLDPSEGFFPKLCDSDDDRVRMLAGFTLNNLEPRVWLEGQSVIPAGSLGFNVRLESNAGTPGLQLRIEVLNHTTGMFDTFLVDTEAFNTDFARFFSIVGPNAANYISATNRVTARAGWKRDGFVINDPWEVRVDRFVIIPFIDPV